MPTIRTRGINHPALIAANIDETVRFYTEVLGMRLVLRQPNLDDPSSTHLFFDAGDGNFIAFFGPSQPTAAPGRAPVGIGSMQHLALNLAVPIEDAMATLRAHGVPFSGPIDRGYERSLYLRDPNDTVVELLSWIIPLPEGADEAEVIARAQRIREAQRAHHIQNEHIVQALAELGFEVAEPE